MADTALFIINASPSITPQVAKTVLNETPNTAICPTPIMLKVVNKLIDITSSVLIDILF